MQEQDHDRRNRFVPTPQTDENHIALRLYSEMLTLLVQFNLDLIIQKGLCVGGYHTLYHISLYSQMVPYNEEPVPMKVVAATISW